MVFKNVLLCIPETNFVVIKERCKVIRCFSRFPITGLIKKETEREREVAISIVSESSKGLSWDRLDACIYALDTGGVDGSSALSKRSIEGQLMLDALQGQTLLLVTARLAHLHLEAREELVRGRWRSLSSWPVFVKDRKYIFRMEGLKVTEWRAVLCCREVMEKKRS